MRYSSIQEIREKNIDPKKRGQVYVEMPKGEMPYGDKKPLNEFGLDDLGGYMTGARRLYPQEEIWIKIV